MKKLPVEFVCFHGRKNTIQTLVKNYSLRNLIKWLPVTLGVYLASVLYYLSIKRLDQAKATIKAILYVILNFGKIWKKRTYVQKNVRKVPDKIIFKMMQPFKLTEIVEGEKIWPR